MSVIDRIEEIGLTRGGIRPAGAVSWSAWKMRYQAAAVLLDFACALVVFLALGSYSAAPTFVLGLIGALTFVLGIALGQGYHERHAGVGSREYRAIARGLFAVVGLAMSLAFFGVLEVRPLPLVLAAAGVAVTAALLRTAQRRVLASSRSRGAMRSRALLVSTPDRANEVARELAEVHPGLEVVGVCVSGREVGTVVDGDVRVWGTTSDASTVLETAGVDLVVVSAGAMSTDDFRRFQWAAERADAKLVVVPGVREVLGNRLDLDVLGATPMLTIRLQPTAVQRIVKSAMDRVLGMLLFVAFAPVIAAGMIAVRLSSSGPGIFRQVRIGRDGRPFTMLKLRTMTVDAELRKNDLLSSSTGSGPLFKMATDPRVTRVGRVLRRFSLDELPQLWNVVRGDMSLVGPRPPLASEVAVYDSMSVHRLHVRPGLTGLWQVSGRSDLSWEQSVRLDLRYVDNWSVGLDFLILWKTVRAVVGADGAY